MKDQYVPSTVDKDELIEKLSNSIGSKVTTISLKLLNSNHNLSEPTDESEVQIFIDTIENLLNEIEQL